ncbi:MAG: hypothetical protein ACTHMS_01545, partial [Jatrophihabitans sp.]|uniref:hypothetical protein n=1 Tax=Jatrophihabitans sp. TaxID=1932789 RepID=UPI003F80A8BD
SAAGRHDPVVWPWLSHAMHHWAPLSSAGEPNGWGLAAVADDVALKNGWAQHPDVLGRLRADLDTTGFVQHDRYAVVQLSDAAPAYYFTRGESIVTAAAARLVSGLGVSATSERAGGRPAAR